MRRVYLVEAVEARPIIKRLTANTVEAAKVLESMLTDGDDATTVKQFRQTIDQLSLETSKLRDRLLAAEQQLGLVE